MLEPGALAPAFDAQPVFGVALRIPADLRRGPVAIAFVGSLASPLTRVALGELQAAFADLDRAGVRVLAVSPSGFVEASDYVPRHHLLFPLVLDEDRAIAARFGVADDVSVMGALASLRPATASRALRSLALGVGLKRAPLGVRAALFLLDRDGKIAFSAVASGPFQGLDLAGLSAAVGRL